MIINLHYSHHYSLFSDQVSKLHNIDIVHYNFIGMPKKSVEILNIQISIEFLRSIVLIIIRV